ncbi:MAG: tetratricopeptide repeat protein, partial [Gemmatimonadetes bacterium]|nr:tetratricopeptide repeat protein [Gemmatimonadota bacterium]
DPTAWSNLGVALHRQDRIPEARDAWTRALAIDPDLKPALDWLQRTAP